MSENTVQCPFCDTQSRVGVRVCKGCQATIVYGATDAELGGAFRHGFMMTFIIAMIAMLAGPAILNEQLGWQLDIMFGFGLYGAIGAALAGLWVGYRARTSTEVGMDGQVRYFRQMAG